MSSAPDGRLNEYGRVLGDVLTIAKVATPELYAVDPRVVRAEALLPKSRAAELEAIIGPSVRLQLAPAVSSARAPVAHDDSGPAFRLGSLLWALAPKPDDAAGVKLGALPAASKDTGV